MGPARTAAFSRSASTGVTASIATGHVGRLPVHRTQGWPHQHRGEVDGGVRGPDHFRRDATADGDRSGGTCRCPHGGLRPPGARHGRPVRYPDVRGRLLLEFLRSGSRLNRRGDDRILLRLAQRLRTWMGIDGDPVSVQPSRRLCGVRCSRCQSHRSSGTLIPCIQARSPNSKRLVRLRGESMKG